MWLSLIQYASHPEFRHFSNLPHFCEIPEEELVWRERQLKLQHPAEDSKARRAKAVAHYLWTTRAKHRTAALASAPRTPSPGNVLVQFPAWLGWWCIVNTLLLISILAEMAWLHK
jgi:hypothetical protein